MRERVSGRDSVGLLRLPALDRLPLEEAVDRDDTAPTPVGVAEGRQLMGGLTLGVDRLASAFGLLDPVGNQASTQRVQRDFAGLVLCDGRRPR
jgi:hypothetical protein